MRNTTSPPVQIKPEGFYLIRITADGKIYNKKVCYGVNRFLL